MSGSGDHYKLEFQTLCVLNTITDCTTFGEGIVENGLHAVMVELAQRVDSAVEDLDEGPYSTTELAKLGLTEAARAQLIIGSVVNGTHNRYLMRLEDDFIKPANVVLHDLMEAEIDGTRSSEKQVEIISLLIFILSKFSRVWW